jgi:TRAP-type C4-dicarboxylate transport system permease small subunit
VTTPTPHASRLAQLDHAIYRAERAVSGLVFLSMSLVMFTYVLVAVFNRQESRLVSIFFSRPPTPANAWWHGPFSTGLSVGITFLLALLAVRTAKLARRPSWPISFALAFGLTAAAAALVKAALVAFPSGLSWAPKSSGVGMLWLGLLGGSMATYEKRHLALEMGEKLWSPKIFHYVKAVSLVTAAVMAGFLLWLAALSIADYRAHHDVVDPTLTWPKATVLMVVPYALGMMALRFGMQAARVVVHPEEAQGGELIPTVPGATDAEVKT